MVCEINVKNAIGALAADLTFGPKFFNNLFVHQPLRDHHAFKSIGGVFHLSLPNENGK
jgi:hypothetical protein